MLLRGGSGNKPKVGGQNKCKKCHELGHREAGCPYNGAKKNGIVGEMMLPGRMEVRPQPLRRAG